MSPDGPSAPANDRSLFLGELAPVPGEDPGTRAGGGFVIATFAADTARFAERRKPYLLYPL